MPTLQIHQIGNTVEVAFTPDGGPRQTVTRPLPPSLSAQDSEDIRWYLEDYLVYPLDPAPKIAKRIEQRMRQIGLDLFASILAGSDVWFMARHRLEQTRIEIESDVREAAIPWELLRDPDADLPLALYVPSFVRGHSRAALRPNPREATRAKIRMLLAICRPGGASDVPFRSVARHLLKNLSDKAREHFELEVLRPPTFEQLAKRLRAAAAKNEPFHVVHFDGHGTSGAVQFENTALKNNSELVTAAALGKLLKETRVPVLILNACRSAYAEPPAEPRPVGDSHQEIREFGSLAHAVMDYGAAGVVAWRYNVFVSTAAQFMADLYGALASGVPLGEAATLARKQLNSRTRPIEDWTVPVIYEAAPVLLFPKLQEHIEIRLEEATEQPPDLPQAPDAGFIGRDETILEIERRFDTQSIVLLHAYAGSGKTSTAVEFSRWYWQTGGLQGPVLYTSLERHKKLGEVLDQFGKTFEKLLEQNKIQWLTLEERQRRSVALQVLKQVPVLWLWDNVEPVSGFPAGATSAWTAGEQSELSDFLREARGTKAKFLLTSRREERDWLHDLPARVPLPPMTFEDRVQMTAAIAEKYGRRLVDVEDWRPLLQFTQGNPLTLTVLVGQALRDGLSSRAQIVGFVRTLWTGEAAFEDEATEGRTRSLGASLAYGFETAFSEAERKQLALLHLFQGFVDVDALRVMGQPDTEWCLPEVRGLSREAGIALLDRAAEVGLVNALGQGYYNIHPALPWFFGRLCQQYYAGTQRAARAFVEAMAHWGDYYFYQYNQGNQEVIGILGLEEANLLHARNLARANDWWRQAISAMQGLCQLYEHTGRRSDWVRLVEEILPDFVDSTSGAPLEGREEVWSVVMEYRVHLARQSRRFEQAERLQRLTVAWDSERAEAILSRPVANWNTKEKNDVRSLAASLHALGQIQREQGLPSCVDSYQGSLAAAEKVGDTQVAAICAFNLGHTFEDLAGVRDLTAAETWYRRSLNLTAENDRMGRGSCLGQLGSLALKRFRDAQTEEERFRHLGDAAEFCEKALELFPADAIDNLAVAHHQLGFICQRSGQLDLALKHFRDSIRYKELLGDRFEAGQTRINVAVSLFQANRDADAREWALAAVRDYESCENANQEIIETEEFLKEIDSALAKASPPQ